MLINANWKPLQKELEALLAEEMVQQGHKLTGALLKSIETIVEAFGKGGVSIGISYFKYGEYLNQGIAPSRIPFGGKSSAPAGKKSAFIEGLKRFVLLRGMTSGLDSEVTSVAFAIAKKMKKEGMPTKGSFQFTNNGRRKQWVEYTMTDPTGAIYHEIEQVGHDYIMQTFDGLISDLLSN